MLHGFEARNFAQGARSFGGVSLDKLSLNGENGGLFWALPPLPRGVAVAAIGLMLLVRQELLGHLVWAGLFRCCLPGFGVMGFGMLFTPFLSHDWIGQQRCGEVQRGQIVCVHAWIRWWVRSETYQFAPLAFTGHSFLCPHRHTPFLSRFLAIAAPESLSYTILSIL